MRTKNHVFSVISLEFVPTPKLSSLKVGPSNTFFHPEEVKKSGIKRVNPCSMSFIVAQKKRLYRFFLLFEGARKWWQVILVSWNEVIPPWSQREIITSGMLVEGQKTISEHVGVASKQQLFCFWETAWCQMQINSLETVSPKDFCKTRFSSSVFFSRIV